MDYLIYVVSIIALIGLCLALLDFLWKPRLDLPSPNRVPLVGNFLSFMKAPHLMTTIWAEEHGNIYCLQLLHKTVVIVTGYEEAHQVLVAKGNDFAGRSPSFRNKFISAGGEGIMFQTYNLKWKKIRMWTHRIIKQFENVDRIEKILQENAKKMVMDIEAVCKNGPFDPYENIYVTVSNITAALITGTNLSLDEPLFQTLLKLDSLLGPNVTFANGAELDVFPWLRYFGNQAYKNLCIYKECQADLFNMLQAMYRNNNLSSDCLAFAIFDEMEKEHGDLSYLLTDQVVKVLLSDTFVPGVSTSGSAFYAFLQLIAAHPGIQQKLFEETITCKNNSNEPINLSDRDSMPYARACLLEALRYSSVAPSTLEHTALVDSDIFGHKIPKGTEVYVNLFGLHHSEKYWEEPWKFKPERFLDEDGHLLLSDHINRKRLMPFGGGIRVCIGQSFAISRLFLLITSVIRKFEISPVPGMELQLDPRKFKASAILNAPRVKLRFDKR